MSPPSKNDSCKRVITWSLVSKETMQKVWFCGVVVLLMWPFPICVSLQANCSTNRPNGGGAPAATTAAAAPAGPSVRSRKPGAVIESFVNHAPGVFSGTFSGEFSYCCSELEDPMHTAQRSS